MKVFYTPAHDGIVPRVIDALEINSAGQEVGRYSNETLEQLARRHPGVMVGDAEAVTLEREAMERTAPAVITEAEFFEALEVLPPEGWTTRQGGESFKMCEYQSGRMTKIYARMGSNYWSFVDVASLPHAEIMDRILTVTEAA